MKGVLNVAMENIEKYGSKEIAVAAIKIALTSDRREEKLLQQEMSKYGISTAAADYGGEFINSVMKIVERAVVSSKEKELSAISHQELSWCNTRSPFPNNVKAIGLNVGVKLE